jgi:hypothetical protein
VAHALTWNWRRRTTQAALVQAFGFSVLFHLLFFGAIEAGYRFDLWRYSPLALLAKWLQPKPDPRTALAPTPAAVREREVQQVPVVFVDVDPSQATEEEPANTPYYAAVSSRASNPEVSRDTDRPQLDGSQDLVLKTLDSDRARPPDAPPPAPVVAQPIAVAEPIPPTRPKEAVAVGPTPPEELPAPPKEEERPALDPGELTQAKPGPEVLRPTPPTAAPNVPEVVEQPRPRPRTLAAARAQMDQNPESALIGRKMAQEGGVRRFSIVSSLEVRATPLGNYDSRFVEAVQNCWYALLEEQRYSFDRLGKVVLDFRLTVDGRITDLRVTESNVGQIYTTICQMAITRPSPYERWPNEVRRMVGADHRDVRFTFYY